MIILKLVIVAGVGCAAVGLCLAFADLHRIRTRPAAQPTVARHRAGAERHNEPYRNPLPSWVRQSLAPTANAHIALPAGPLEETCALRAPGDDYEVDEYEAADEHWLDELTGNCICGEAWPCDAWAQSVEVPR